MTGEVSNSRLSKVEVLCKIALSRIQTQVDLILRDEQHGFRTNRSCFDLIVSLPYSTEGIKRVVSADYFRVYRLLESI